MLEYPSLDRLILLRQWWRPSLDPVVFFKIALVGYLESIWSDRALERMINMRLDLRFFIDYDIVENVPDRSTICKTKQRIPTEVFDDVFNHIHPLCVKQGLVDGYPNAHEPVSRIYYKDSEEKIIRMRNGSN